MVIGSLKAFDMMVKGQVGVLHIDPSTIYSYLQLCVRLDAYSRSTAHISSLLDMHNRNALLCWLFSEIEV
jgi:hypothetical protein